MSRTFDRRLGAAATAVGIRRKPALDPRMVELIDDWIKLVTGRPLAAMSTSELARLERLFGSDTLMGDDASDLVVSCMDEHQHVVDLDEMRQRLDSWRPS